MFAVLLVGGTALATVGGPTYISSIAFNAKENSVYYIVHDNGGRGCPPIIHKVNVATGTHSEVKSCDQLESEDVHSEEGRQKYNQFIHDTVTVLPALGSVSLSKNRIDVQVKSLRAEFMEGFEEPVWWNFEARIAQDGKEIKKINFRGCAKDQPHIFEGYMVPNSGKMAILISNKGDCFEGGYVKESLHLISGIKYYDTNIVRSFKEESATEPNTGNLVVYADQAPRPAEDPNLPESESTSNTKNRGLIYAIVALLLGLGIGVFASKRVRK